MRNALLICLAALLPSLANRGQAETLKAATYDVDSYMFMGFNTSDERGLTLTKDLSAGVVAADNAHFIFAVIKFDDIEGLSTKAAGGGDKFLRLSTDTFPGPATVAASIARADIEADDASGYPSPLFSMNPFGTNLDRLRWYMQNIKGDDPAFGGYAGGATHVGILEVDAPGTYQIDVTSAVDSWIDGSRPNFGFGLWGVAVSGGQGNTFDLASLENPSGGGPVLAISASSNEPMPGDANGDGVVDRRDLAQLLGNFGRAEAVWSDGDFDGNGRVGLTDVVILQSHLAPLASSTASAVPEPNGIALSLAGALALFAAVRFRREGDGGHRP